ncbi:hypothetical protein PRIPAC_88138 [Pristionchus pacificus]|uniref:BED-type domain-containing protein n=1 Tax=Pristionchus pacificus TaxID=54126 RepID=A0A2A6B6Z8_PRIPA|nr:hypothetical protein PRIPAC_88138 [Pristionchus pacificus]|eukprot:PDM61623.1 hypothetical protein PRIPAC_51065 [Pristionchus pacificus]
MPRFPGRSAVWQFFTVDPSGKAQCNTCGLLVSRTRGNTKAMATHMISHNQALSSKKDVEDIEKRVARFLASTNTAANVVENNSFRDLFSKEDQAHLPSRK